MKKHLLLLSLFVMACQLATAQVSFGQAEPFNDGWLFSLDDNAAMSKPSYQDQSFRQLDLPHDWSIEGQLSPDLASCTGYLPGGVGWYRKHFTIYDDSPKHYIYFEGVYNRSEVYLNGHLLGKRPNGYASFLYDMTPYLNKSGKENVLAVRVDHSKYADSRWYTGSGIYRDVWVITSGKTHLSQWGSTYRYNQSADGKGQVEVDYSIDVDKKDQKKPMQIVVSLKDKEGNEVASQTKSDLPPVADGKVKGTLVLPLDDPHLWDIRDPYLYTLTTDLRLDGNIVDSNKMRAGMRTLRFDANTGFWLNGRNMKVKGVCLHHDAGVLGAVVPREVWYRRVKQLQLIGANAIRMSHNPQAPCLYDICDELGMLVMDEASDEWEFPKRKWVKGWNQGEPSYDGSFDFFEEWIDRDVADMVMRDRNHPCVFLWSIGNEVDYPNDPYSHPVLDGTTINQPMFGGYKPDAPNAERIGIIAKRLSAVVRSIDTSRPVTGALAGVVMSNQTAYPEAIDVVGYNYTENRYDEDHKTYPSRILYGSETSTDYNAWKAVRDKDFIFGQFVWTGTDYLGESGRWPSRGLNTGLMNFASYPKGRGWFHAALWREDPVTYIGSYPMPQMRGNGRGHGGRGGRRGNFVSIDALDDWNYQEGMQIRVVCYTNSPQARLWLNDSLVGDLKPVNDTTGVVYWDIPFQAGTLRGEGCDSQGNVMSSYDIKTYSQATALRARVEELGDGYDCECPGFVSQISINITDKDGNVVKNAANEIVCSIDGPAKLLGLEGSNNSDMGDYRDNKQAAYRGSLFAYIRRIGKGPVKVRFSADGLSQTEVEL